jgi:hypothetical protein
MTKQLAEELPRKGPRVRKCAACREHYAMPSQRLCPGCYASGRPGLSDPWNTSAVSSANIEGVTTMLAPFNPDPGCPFCHGCGFKRVLDDEAKIDVTGRCECTNWSAYAALRRSKGLTMQQAMDEIGKA